MTKVKEGGSRKLEAGEVQGKSLSHMFPWLLYSDFQLPVGRVVECCPMDPKLPFIHPSYAHEQQLAEDNQRLEFLGDAVLGLLASEMLYETFPLAREGTLTKLKVGLVRKETLAAAARRLGFGRKLLLGEGERRSGGAERDSNLADAFEAWLGWMWVEEGPKAARAKVRECLAGEMEALRDDPEALEDPKSLLQAACQERGLGLPEYRTTGEEGSDHARSFRVRVWIQDRQVGEGAGASKKAAEQAAAREALDQIEKT